MKIKRTIVGLIVLLGISVTIRAQSFEWVRTAGGQSNGFGDYGYAVATDHNGNVFVAGVFNTEIKFNNGTVAFKGGSNAYVAKYDAAGNFLWARQIKSGGNAACYCIACDSKGNAYINWAGGVFNDTAQFGNGKVLYGFNCALVSYDPDGNCRFVSANDGIDPRAIAVDKKDNVIIQGQTYKDVTINGSQKILAPKKNKSFNFIAKYTSDGTYLWGKGYDIPDYIYALSTDADNNIVLGGGYSQYIKFGSDSESGSSSFVYDFFLAKADESGIPLWLRMASSTGGDMAFGLTVDKSGNIYATGQFGNLAQQNTKIIFGSDTLKKTSGNFGDFFVVKYDKNGNEKWARQSYGPSNGNVIGRAITAGDSGYVYTTGEYYVKTTFNGTDTLYSKGACNVHVCKWDSMGKPVWQKTGGGHRGIGDFGFGITADTSGNVIVTGTYGDTATFGNIKIDPLHDPSKASTNDAFIAKIGNQGKVVSGFAEASTAMGSYTAYPNPSRNGWYLEGNLDAIATVSVFDILGNKIAAMKVGQLQRRIFISSTDLQPGVYFLSISNGLGICTLRMVKD